MRGLIGRAAVAGGAVVALMMGLVAGTANAGVNQAASLTSASPGGTLTPLPPNTGGKRLVDPTFPYKATSHAMALAAAGQTLPMWQQSESYPAGNPYTYTMVGSSPFTAGAGTTTITAPIIPIKFVLQTAGTTLSDASQVASDCSQTLSPVGLTQNSPMFQSQVSDPAGNKTQWVDALQRGNFNQQTQTGGISPNYHLLLSATTPGGITITVPDADTSQHAGATCGTLSGVDITWFESNFPTIVSNLVTSKFISPTQFPLFVMYNTFLCPIANCNSGDGGYHSELQTASGLQIYGLYDYDLTGDFAAQNTATMSHELAEAIDDPLGTNPVPTWGYTGQDQTGCQQNLEPGDPLSAGYTGSPGLVADTYTLGSTSYTFDLQDMAYHSWFYRESSPPTSKNVGNMLGSGQYSLFGFFTGPSSTTVCPGQPTGVTATAGNGQATVSWTAGPGPADSYIVIPYQGGTPQSPRIFSSTATSQTVTGLTNGSSYTFTVVAAHANSNSVNCPYNQFQQSAETGFDCSTESIPSNAVTPSPPAAGLSQPSLSFGNQQVHTTSAPLTETVTNTGPGTLNISAVSIGGTNPGDFAKGTDTCTGAALAPAGTCSVAVSFAPTAGGSRGAQLSFTDNAAASPQFVPLSGKGDSVLLAVVGSDNGLWVNQDGQGYTGLGGQLVAAVAVVSVPAANAAPVPLYIGTGTDHNVYVRSGTAPWQSLSSSAVDCVDNVGAAFSGGTLTVACQGGDHALWYAQGAVSSSGLPTLNGWQSLGGVLSAGPAVAPVAGTVTFIVTGSDGTLWSRTVSTGYVALNASCKGRPAVATQGSVSYLACHGLDDALWYSVNSGSGWGSFRSAGGVLIDAPAIAATSTQVTIYVEGSDTAVYHTVIPLGGGTASGYTFDGGQVKFGTAAAGLVDAGTWATLATGEQNNCAIRTNGTLWCWGANDGFNGTGTTSNDELPTQVGSDANWVAVSTGGATCAIRTDHTLWCWGANLDGEVGTGDTSPRPTPTQVGSATDWATVSVSAGDTGPFTCATRTDGTLWCWGSNFSGQLGTGDTTNRLVPTQVGSATDWAAVSTDQDDTCATRTDGTLWCWGDNTWGQLGTGNTTSESTPTEVGSGTSWADVSVGDAWACAVSTSGTLWCWGYNLNGQLGTGNTTNSPSQVQIGSATSWASVSARSGESSCATRTDGTLWCWGTNGDGELGTGDTTNHLTPNEVGSVTSWATVSGGTLYYNCATRTDHTLWCWGAGFNGALGTGDLSDLIPTEVT